MAFRAFKLDKVAETRRVSIATSIDAAQLSKRHIHTTMGIKINDKEAICPFTDRPIFGYDENDSSQESTLVHSLVQSRNCCFPVKIVLAKETKSIYKHFESVFKTFTTKNEALESSALLGASYKPLKTSIECDMSAQWKGLGRGGGMNNQLQYPCQCCAINDAHVVTPNAVHCNTWCKQYREDYPDEHHNWQCFHLPMLTKEKLKVMEEELEDLNLIISHFCTDIDELHSKSVVSMGKDPRVPSGNEIHLIDNIHYDPSGRGQQELVQHTRLVVKDLLLWKLPLNGNLIQKKDRLQKSLIKEYNFLELRNNLEQGTVGQEEALFILSDTLPCILHMETCVGLKLLTRILDIGLVRARAGEMYREELRENA